MCRTEVKKFNPCQLEAILLCSCLTLLDIKIALSAFREGVARGEGVLTSCWGLHNTYPWAASCRPLLYGVQDSRRPLVIRTGGTGGL